MTIRTSFLESQALLDVLEESRFLPQLLRLPPSPLCRTRSTSAFSHSRSALTNQSVYLVGANVTAQAPPAAVASLSAAPTDGPEPRVGAPERLETPGHAML